MWFAYPWARHTYLNKLWLSEMMGYICGPSGIPIPKTGEYIVRPIYNLDGMSRGAECKFLDIGDESTPPGYFWCEYFNGNHYSVDYIKVDDTWKLDLVVQAYKVSPQKFTKWEIIDKQFTIPKFLYDVKVSFINIEYIDDKIIEIHFRGNSDFKNHKFKTLLVQWKSEPELELDNTWTFIPSYEETDKDTRIGFYGK